MKELKLAQDCGLDEFHDGFVVLSPDILLQSQSSITIL